MSMEVSAVIGKLPFMDNHKRHATKRADPVLSLMDYNYLSKDKQNILFKTVMTSECAQLSLEFYILFDSVTKLVHI